MTGSYWLAEERPRLPATRLTGAVEVAIVGGGVTGCACALALAEAAASVMS
jgi:glycerol-3-phosphate dehydrogenase